MGYKEQEKKDIEQVIDVFRDVIDSSKDLYGDPNMDVLWSNSIGVYYFVYHDMSAFGVGNKALLIRSARQLFGIMARVVMDQKRNEWYKDYMKEMDRSAFITKLYVRDLLKESIDPYLAQLPQYDSDAHEAINASVHVEVHWG